MSWDKMRLKVKLTGLKLLLDEETKKKHSVQNRTKIKNLTAQISDLEKELKKSKGD